MRSYRNISDVPHFRVSGLQAVPRLVFRVRWRPLYTKAKYIVKDPEPLKWLVLDPKRSLRYRAPTHPCPESVAGIPKDMIGAGF